MTDQNILKRLGEVLAERKSASPESSYVASLYADGVNRVLEKIGEEAIELIIAAKDANDTTGREKVVKEAADVWFHTLVLLSQLDLSPEDLLSELENRFGVSGIEEKAARAK